MPISLSTKGDFKKTRTFLTRALGRNIYSDLAQYGQEGVDALSSATPKDSGVTANSWRYRIIKSRNKIAIEWYNINVVNGSSIAILLQYGHGTGTGGYVQGRDYINPAIQPIFDKIANNVWKKVNTP